MKKLICLLLMLAGLSLAQTKYLHVSTIPAKADIFVGNNAPDYSKFPDYTSPDFIPVENGESQVLLAIFRPDFTDTLINVTLSAKDTSYLIVSLRPSYDEHLSKKQQKIISKRNHRSLGKKIMLSSILPFMATAVSSAVTLYEVNKAENAKKILKSSHIATGQHYDDAKQDFKDARSTAKTAKKVAIGTAIGAAAIVSLGFIISF